MVKRIINLLSKKQKKQGIWVVITMLIRSILDFAGIAALVPVIFVISDKLGNERRLVLLLCCGVVLFVIFKNFLIYLLSRFQTKYQLDLYRDFSSRLFYNYYTRGLLFLKKHSSMQLAYEVNGICLTFSQSVIGSLFRIAGEGFLIILLVAALIVWKPMMGVLTAALFIPIAAIYAVAVRKRVRELGKQSLDALRKQSRTVAETFRGYPELEIANAFETSRNSFHSNLDAIVENRRSMEIYQLFPFFLSEMAVIAGLIFLAAFGGQDLVVTGGVFAVAAFRIIPAAKGVMNNYATLQNNINSVEVIEKGISPVSPDSKAENTNAKTGSTANEMQTDFQSETEQRLNFERKITVREMDFAFPDGEKIIEQLNFEIKKGERIGIRGKSGSGKSTLFNLLLGFYDPTGGSLYIDDIALTHANRKDWHRIVGYVPQEIFIIQGTLAHNIALGEEEIDLGKVWKVLEQVSLKDWAENLKNGLDSDLGEFGSRLSGGQKQRIGIARALYKGAKVLFFDEATSSLDGATEKEINEALEELSEKNDELTMIIIAHRESSLTFCDRIIDM
ncbi:MAG: ABC transporter ATP-binding protein [Muribaculaceae bacterium]|nr:ABC transporter ATP-binding protein [Muribaculaceae bacterium]